MDEGGETSRISRRLNTAKGREGLAKGKQKDKQKEDKLKKLATRDPLTNLLNRRGFDEVLTTQKASADRYHEALSVAFLDLDGFKVINDMKGHEKGDTILVEVTEFLESKIRESDTLGRYGGDEFVLILPKSDKKEAKEKLEIIKTSFESEFKKDSLSYSFGVSDLSETKHVEELISLADKGMYEDKKKKK